jgi:hypothetical protein
MEMTLVDVTPDMAREWITHNTNNRPVSADRIASYANQMRLGQWQVNGSTVTFSTDERLLDGQHRLGAVVVSGCTVPMLIVKGVQEDAFKTIDTGRTRRSSDILAMAGFRNSTNASAVGAQIWRMFWAALADFNRRVVVPPAVVLEVMERWPEIEKWTAEVSRRPVLGRAPASTMVPALIYLADIAKRPDLSKALFEGLTTGAFLARDSPILALRNKFFELRASDQHVRTDWVWGYMVKVIDALEADEPLTKLGQPAPYQVTIPAKLKLHMADMSPERMLIDLKPQDGMTRVRDQRELLKLVGITDPKAFAAILPPAGHVKPADPEDHANQRAELYKRAREEQKKANLG